MRRNVTNTINKSSISSGNTCITSHNRFSYMLSSHIIPICRPQINIFGRTNHDKACDIKIHANKVHNVMHGKNKTWHHIESRRHTSLQPIKSNNRKHRHYTITHIPRDIPHTHIWYLHAPPHNSNIVKRHRPIPTHQQHTQPRLSNETLTTQTTQQDTHMQMISQRHKCGPRTQYHIRTTWIGIARIRNVIKTNHDTQINIEYDWVPEIACAIYTARTEDTNNIRAERESVRWSNGMHGQSKRYNKTQTDTHNIWMRKNTTTQDMKKPQIYANYVRDEKLIHASSTRRLRIPTKSPICRKHRFTSTYLCNTLRLTHHALHIKTDHNRTNKTYNDRSQLKCTCTS